MILLLLPKILIIHDHCCCHSWIVITDNFDGNDNFDDDDYITITLKKIS